MKNLYFFATILLCLFSCKTEKHVSDNTNYSTPPEIGGVMTDLPRKSTYIHTTEPDSRAKNKVLSIDSTSAKTDNNTQEKPLVNQKNEEEIYTTSISEENTLISTNQDKTLDIVPADTIHLAPTIYSKKEEEPVTKSVKSEESISGKDSLDNKNTEAINSYIRNLNVEDFSWEVGIKITQILDVRSLKEFKNGHIYDAINMDVNQPNFVNQILSLDKTNPVAIYSQHGKRSIKAAKILAEYGFKIIYNLTGGLDQWAKEKKEIFR